MGEYWVSCLVERFGFTKDEVHRLAWAEEVNTGRLVVYIRDPFSKVCGVHTRAREGQYPKTRDYRRSEHYVGWFFPEGTGNESCKGPIILVEDVLSAAKVSTAGFVAVSLMGSNLSLEQLGDIQAVSQGGTVALALDRDATGKAIELASRYRFLSGGNLIPMLLSKDLKYHTKEEIVQMVGDVIGSSE
ncbi:MAG: hypothetical protein KGL39_08820 [Patescibacteria group bacterium]|nr:hypothetical protein [Patescibacteria group bacterium]